MAEALFYLISSFWLGALHAATPGHGKTIAASYIVGVRGRPIDALVLGLFVTLSHTSGIVLVAGLATFGSTWLLPQRVEAYLALGTGCLVIGIGLWMLRSQWGLLSITRGDGDDDGGAHTHAQAHGHPHDPAPVVHRHGWGRAHTHDLEAVTGARPSLPILLGLGVAGGLLPDPGALAILLAAIASGKLILGLFTVLVFSLGFASVLVVVGLVAVRVGRMLLAWLTSRWVAWVQIGLALVIVAVGLVLTANAARLVVALR
jgi:nickel/cobalt exporter